MLIVSVSCFVHSDRSLEKHVYKAVAVMLYPLNVSMHRSRIIQLRAMSCVPP